jgi:hypothetical protein
MEPGVEALSCDGQPMIGVRLSGSSREYNASTGRAEHDHFADRAARRWCEVEFAQKGQPAGSDEVAAGLVPRECRRVDERHPSTGAGQDESSNAAGGTATNHDDVVEWFRHGDPGE